MQETVRLYDLSDDPYELKNIEISQEKSQNIRDEVLLCRKSTLLSFNKDERGQKVLFDRWICRYTEKLCSAKYDRDKSE